MNQAVTDYISNIKVDWQAEVANELRNLINQNVPGIEERIQYSKPHFLLNGKYAFVLGTAKEWVSLTIFNAQKLETPEGMFETSENGERKTIKHRKGQAVDSALLAGLMQQATR
jgi:hypothetical protein